MTRKIKKLVFRMHVDNAVSAMQSPEANTLAKSVERHRAALSRVGLPTSYDAASFEDLHAAMKVDKKARGSQLRFVVLDDLASPRILAGPGEDDLRAAYTAIASAG